jgi:ATP-dependent helicase HrpB
VTEGVLLRQMLSDPTLRGVSAICFDEFHERHLYSDITLARAVEMQRNSRPDLLLVVMSATLETAALREYLAPCELLAPAAARIQWTLFICSALPVENLCGSLSPVSLNALHPEPRATCSCFFPGSYEIHRTIEALRNTRAARDCIVLPLHGELPPNEQDAAVARHSKRKIIVSTNVAETSLTIDGVRVVLDAGLAKIARFDAYRGINTLLTTRVSRASADQRAGRAGRHRARNVSSSLDGT